MKKRSLAAAVLASTLSLASLGVAFGQTAPAPAAPAPAPGALQILDFKPGFDDMMTMMVQPRHLKLFFAAREKNWELAAFESDELRASFRRIGQTVPIYRTQDVNKAVAVMATPLLDRVDKAIKAKDAALFAKEYSALTAGCNACHTQMEHAFLVMKVPDNNSPSLYPDQVLGLTR